MSPYMFSAGLAECPECNGLGEVPIGPDLDGFLWQTCPTCGGDGLMAVKGKEAQ